MSSLIFCVFVDFPFISYGRSFLTEDHKCDFFFYGHLACSNIFLCVHIPNAIKVFCSSTEDNGAFIQLNSVHVFSSSLFISTILFKYCILIYSLMKLLVK